MRASASGSIESMCGEMPAFAMNCISSASSVRVPIVEPWTRSCRKKIRFSSADFGAWPLVAPEITSVPPCLSDFSECDQVA